MGSVACSTLVVLGLVLSVSSPNNTATLCNELLNMLSHTNRGAHHWCAWFKYFSSGGRRRCCAGVDLAMTRMLSSNRLVACCSFVVIMAGPSHMTSTAHSGCHPVAYVTKHHGIQNGHQHEQQQRQRRYHPQHHPQHHQDLGQDHQYQQRRLQRHRQQELGCGTWQARLPSFIAVPARPTAGRTLENVGGAPHHARPQYFSTALGAAGGKGKSSKAAKKKKNGSSREGGGGSGGSGGSNGGGGFGASTAATAVKPSGKASTSPTTPTSTSTGAAAATAAAAGTTTTHRPSRPAALLPDDDFATFPPLSPDTLKSVMGVDVFDLPPGGVSAKETSQQDALPPQVLDCIRDRHGFLEFAGGMRLLDTAYLEGAVGAGAGEDATTAAAGEAVATDGPLETLEGRGELSVGGGGRESPPPAAVPGAAPAPCRAAGDRRGRFLHRGRVRPVHL